MTTIPADRFQNFLWWWLTRNAQSHVDVEKLRARLWMPPPDVTPEVLADKRNPWSPDNETSAFAAFKSGLGAKGG